MACSLQSLESMKNNKNPSLTKYYLSFIFLFIAMAYSFSWAEIENRVVSCNLSNKSFNIEKNIRLYKSKVVEIDRDGELFPFTFQSVNKIENDCHLTIISNTNVDLIIPLDGKENVRAKVYKLWELSGPCQVLDKDDKSTDEKFVEILREFYGDEVKACNTRI